jgi:predicted ATP-binding protein involved in virulence
VVPAAIHDKVLELCRYPDRMISFNYFSPTTGTSFLTLWIKTQELILLREKRSNRVLEALKEAIRRCVRDVQTISYDFREDDLYVCFSEKEGLPFRMVSEGVRNRLAMVADICYRAALLNPQFEEMAPQKTPGIVLIDEIEHLRKILPPRTDDRTVDGKHGI